MKGSIIISSGYVGEGEAVITDMSTSYRIEKEELFKNSYALFVMIQIVYGVEYLIVILTYLILII